MKFKRAVRRVLWNLQPGRWLSFSTLKGNANFIAKLAKGIASKKEEGDTPDVKSFTEYVASEGLTKEDLLARQKQAFTSSIILTVIAIVAWIYSVYVFSHYQVIAGIVTVLLGFLAAVYGWAEHVNYTKIRFKRLCLSPKDWFSLNFSRK